MLGCDMTLHDHHEIAAPTVTETAGGDCIAAAVALLVPEDDGDDHRAAARRAVTNLVQLTTQLQRRWAAAPRPDVQRKKLKKATTLGRAYLEALDDLGPATVELIARRRGFTSSVYDDIEVSASADDPSGVGALNEGERRMPVLRQLVEYNVRGAEAAAGIKYRSGPKSELRRWLVRRALVLFDQYRPCKASTSKGGPFMEFVHALYVLVWNEHQLPTSLIREQVIPFKKARAEIEACTCDGRERRNQVRMLYCVMSM